MRRYETTYILRPNLGEDQFTEVIDRTNAIVKNDGGAIINLDRWGTRKLAYEIKKETLGYYVYFDYAAPGTTIKEIERIFRIDDRVLRFLTVKLADSIDEESIAKATEEAAASAALTESATEDDAEETEKDEKPDASADKEVASDDSDDSDDN